MRRIGLAVLALVVAAGTLSAQRPRRGEGRGLREVRNEGSVGFDFLIAEPLDDFSRTGQVAFGIGGHAVVGLSRNSGLGLRIDGAYQMYESNYRGYGISTSSSIASLAIGPQISAGVGPIRPYAFATFGGSVFWTTLGDDGYCDCYESDVFFLNGRTTTATQLGAGVQFLLSRSRRPIAIDLGVRDLRHSRVRYVPVGGINDHGDGTYTVNRVETPVHQRVFQLGLSFGIR